MPVEALQLPQFDGQTAHDVINDLAKRARDAELGWKEYKDIPHQLRELEEHKLFFAMLEVRASERLAGRNVDVDMHKTGQKNDYDNTLIDIHLDGQENDYDHEFSQNQLTLYAGNAILHTTLPALAEIRGITSLDVLNLIGKPTQEYRGGENERETVKRYINELTLVNKYKVKNPDSAERMDVVATEIAKRLIDLKKRKPGYFSIGFQVTDIETGQGNLLFTSMVRDPNSYWGDPDITDWKGEIYYTVASIPSTNMLEETVASDIVEEYITLPGLTEYDFWVIRGEKGGNITTWNKSKDPKKADLDGQAA